MYNNILKFGNTKTKNKKGEKIMKKFLVLFLTLALVLSFAACKPAGTPDESTPAGETPAETPKASEPAASESESEPVAEFDPAVKSEGVMTYAEYMAAEMDSEVTVEAFVQGHQSWWDNKITVYAQDLEGGYFFYEMACSEEDAAKLVPGTRIKVTGTKGAWAGEIEIMNATFEILDGTWVVEPTDVTALLGTDELINHQNKLVSFKGMTVVKVEYKNGEPGDDIYVTLSKDGAEYSFCVEIYLTGENTDVYKAVGALKENATVDVEGFLYWYEGVNTHITGIKVK